MFKFLARRGCEDMTIILAGDFNVNAKDNYNAEVVEFRKLPSERLDLILESIYLSCMNYVSYFSYQRPILNTTNHQAPQLTDVTTN
jgi:hypothetical protein